jgi:pyruvate/2-oxoglutarate dehydrogenase complex dihydrolipoamide acyltransferase (E2) component
VIATGRATDAVVVKTRFSKKALTLIEQFGLDPTLFDGRPLVKEDDVRAYLTGRDNTPAAPRAEPPAVVATAALPAPIAQQRPVRAADGIPTRVEPLRRSKRLEGRHLRAAIDSTILSAVTVTVPTFGFFSQSQRDAKSMGLAAAAVIFETGRLLRLYPLFNAFHHNGNVHYYEQVNIGYALDAGNGLKVPVIHEADRKSLREIAAEKQRRLVEYLDESLPVAALSGGTFTITDLSGEDVFHFHPVVNEGQSAILGICSEWQRGGEPPAAFNLVLAFDHQLAEGRTAASFLHDLSDRIRGHEESMRGAATTSEEEPMCAVCRRPLTELEESRHHLVTIAGRGARTQMLCTICLADW